MSAHYNVQCELHRQAWCQKFLRLEDAELFITEMTARNGELWEYILTETIVLEARGWVV